MTTKLLFGFHAVGVRVKTAPTSIVEMYVDANRRDTRMRQFTDKAKSANLKIIEADSARLLKLAGSNNHQGVVAKVSADVKQESLDELLESGELVTVKDTSGNITGYKSRNNNEFYSIHDPIPTVKVDVRDENGNVVYHTDYQPSGDGSASARFGLKAEKNLGDQKCKEEHFKHL